MSRVQRVHMSFAHFFARFFIFLLSYLLASAAKMHAKAVLQQEDGRICSF
jgi:hypothetical protein